MSALSVLAAPAPNTASATAGAIWPNGLLINASACAVTLATVCAIAVALAIIGLFLIWLTASVNPDGIPKPSPLAILATAPIASALTGLHPPLLPGPPAGPVQAL